MNIQIQPIIQIDTREQRPLDIRGYETERVTLPVGDIGIRGQSSWDSPNWVVERKSLDDLVQSLTHGRARFEREILKMRQFNFKALVIEAERGQVEIGDYRSAARPNSILQSLTALIVRQNLHVLWCGSHEGAARMVESLIRHHVKNLENQIADLSRVPRGAGVA